jgi:hypothetical protein
MDTRWQQQWNVSVIKQSLAIVLEGANRSSTINWQWFPHFKIACSVTSYSRNIDTRQFVSSPNFSAGLSVSLCYSLQMAKFCIIFGYPMCSYFVHASEILIFLVAYLHRQVLCDVHSQCTAFWCPVRLIICNTYTPYKDRCTYTTDIPTLGKNCTII